MARNSWVGQLYAEGMTVGVRHLRAFLEVVHQGSITDAAVALGVSQPSVSRMIRELEDHLGLTLLERSTRHIALTEAGDAYRLRAAAAVHAVDAVLSLDPPRPRPIRVGHSWAAFGTATARILSSWRAAHPDSPIELQRHDDHLAGIGASDVDLVIVRDLPPETAAPLQRAWLGSEPRVAALPRSHPLATRKQVEMADLAADTLVVNTRAGNSSRALWLPPFDQVAGTAEVTSTEDWLFAIAAGEGIGITSEATAHVAQSPDVAYVPLEGVHRLTVEAAWFDPPAHPLTRELVAFVAAAMASPAQGS